MGLFGWKSLVATGAAVGGVVAAGATAKVVSDRARVRRRAHRGEGDQFGSLHATPRSVLATDDVSLQVEVDEPDDDAGPDVPTIVFAHGWVLDLDCWHYQRAALRGKARLVFYDQRSHGRSGRSTPENATLAQLGEDLRSVIEAVAPSGPLILVGHSMGGMTVMSLAALDPALVSDRVVGVVLMGTSAGELTRPGGALGRIEPVLSRMGLLIDQGRRLDTYPITRRFAVGPEADPIHADMTDEMIARAPTRLFWEFYPNFVTLDLFDGLGSLPGKRTVVMGGTSDLVTPYRHSRRLAEAIDGAQLVTYEGSGHMMMLEEHAAVSATLLELVEETS